MFDLVIVNGIVIDGAGNPRRRADVAVKDGRIAKIGRVDSAEAARVIDAEGLVVAPGFIDLHTHYDAQVFWDPYLTTSGWHGVTTALVGNCGFGFAPVRPELRERAMLSMTAVEAIPTETLRAGLPWDWVTFPEYLDSIERTPRALNVMSYLPLNSLLVWVLGLEGAKSGEKPTDAQHAEMVRVLGEALDAGACGWSAQCLGQPGQKDGRFVQGDFDATPMPTDIMWPETRMVLAEALGAKGHGMMQASGVPNDEVEALVERSRRPYIWQAVAANEKTGFYKTTMAWLRTCHERGLAVYGQAITTDAPIIFTLRDQAFLETSPLKMVHAAEGVAAKCGVLRDEGFRSAMAEWPMFFFDDLADMTLIEPRSAAYDRFAGEPLGKVAAELGVRPVDVLAGAAIESELGTVFGSRQFGATLDGYRQMVEDPYLLPGLSDGGAHVSFLSAGCYGTEYLSRFVRDLGFTALEQAHWRLSGFPAFCAGITDRGVLREGAAADIIVYDLGGLGYLTPRFVDDLPAGQTRAVIGAKGYRYTIVNGQVTIENDTETGAMAGALLRSSAQGACVR